MTFSAPPFFFRRLVVELLSLTVNVCEALRSRTNGLVA